jgi:predicted transcriptional regulator
MQDLFFRDWEIQKGEEGMTKSLVEMSAEIVAAQASNTPMSPEDLVKDVRKVFETLQKLQTIVDGSEFEQGMSTDPQASIQRNQVICLECRRSFKLLSNRHLALHGLTPREYKRKHGIRMTQALSAYTLSARRRKLARELGMGQNLSVWRAERKRQTG